MSNGQIVNPQPSDGPQATGRESVAWWHWHRRLYDWVIHFAQTRHGVTALFILSFAESSFFPIPPDVLLGPLALGAPKKWLRFALACSVASVLGGILGYCIGMFLWSLIGQWVFAHLGAIGLTEANFAKFQEWYDKYDFWIVFTCGFTPLPYKVCTISAGVAEISFIGFLIASTEILHRRGPDGLEGRKNTSLYRKIFQLVLSRLCCTIDWRLPCDKMGALGKPPVEPGAKY